jgi:hypothetical protein
MLVKDPKCLSPTFSLVPMFYNEVGSPSVGRTWNCV